MPERLFTVEEANALVPRLNALLPRLRQAVHAYKDAAEQLTDLQSMFVDGLPPPEAAEAERLESTAVANREAAEGMLVELSELGVELKDPTTGLVDFRTRRNGDEAYLCWKEGEKEIAHWHPLVGGFAARRPL